MKELSIEEKAKAYDEALEKARLILQERGNEPDGAALLSKLFPHLRESDDERIRKTLYGWVCAEPDDTFKEGFTKEQILAWLEKQGEQKPLDIEIPFGAKDSELVEETYHIPDGYHAEINSNTVVIKKGEQKPEIRTTGYWNVQEVKQNPADKVEPKFHEGDWVVYKNDICQIVKREEGCNKLVTVFGIEKELVNERNLSTAHLWTLQDAKDGDVLYECNEKKPFIFKELKTKHIGDIASYCDIFNDIFNPNKDDWTTLDIVPATKEQREQLKKAMADAGYTFDFEKKELKKIEKKPTWNKEDEEMYKKVETSINSYYAPFSRDAEEMSDWFKSLKDRVQS